MVSRRTHETVRQLERDLRERSRVGRAPAVRPPTAVRTRAARVLRDLADLIDAGER